MKIRYNPLLRPLSKRPSLSALHPGVTHEPPFTPSFEQQLYLFQPVTSQCPAVRHTRTPATRFLSCAYFTLLCRPRVWAIPDLRSAQIGTPDTHQERKQHREALQSRGATTARRYNRRELQPRSATAPRPCAQWRRRTSPCCRDTVARSGSAVAGSPSIRVRRALSEWRTACTFLGGSVEVD